MSTDQDLTLDLYPLVVPDPAATLAERFAAFHAANPHVYTALVRLIEDDQALGLKRTSMKAVYEDLRRRGMRTVGSGLYRLNNSWTAFYSRLIIEERPDLAGMLETRQQRTARAA